MFQYNSAKNPTSLIEARLLQDLWTATRRDDPQSCYYECIVVSSMGECRNHFNERDASVALPQPRACVDFFLSFLSFVFHFFLFISSRFVSTASIKL